MVRLRFTRPEVRSLSYGRSFGALACVRGKAHCAVGVVSHSCAKNAQEWGTPGLALSRAVLTGIGVPRLHFVIGFANDKVPLRMTGLKRAPISQRAHAA